MYVNILFRAVQACYSCNHHDELKFSVPFLTQESSIFLQQNYQPSGLVYSEALYAEVECAYIHILYSKNNRK
jgi:hypothetical protein